MTTNHDNTRVPAELAPIAAAVDDLAARERGSAPVTLEDRLFISTRARISGARAAASPPEVVVRPVRIFTGARIAAAVALVGATLALYMAQVAQPTGSPSGGPGLPARVDLVSLEADVDLLLALRTGSEMQEGIDDLYLHTEELRSSIKDDLSQTILDDGVM